MLRNLKLLGLAAMAALAVGTMGSATAQAATFTSEAGSTTVISTQDGTGKTAHHVIDAAGANLTCAQQAANASWIGQAIIGIRLFVGMSLCSAVGQTATVNMNGCSFELEAAGNMDIICPEGKGITYSAPNPVCDVVIPAQANKGTVTYTNVETAGSKEITVSPNVADLKYTATGAGCPEAGTFENGTYTTGNYLLTGQDHAGNTIDIAVVP